MIKAHEIKLYPNALQEQFFKRSCGASRFAYNWALNRWNEYHAKGINTSGYSLRKEFNSIKLSQFPWVKELGKTATDYPILNLEKGFKAFFKHASKRPKFKKKGVRDSFVAVENYHSFKQKNGKIWVPRLGWVKCVEMLRFHGKVNNVVIKRISNKWFAVVNIDVNESIIEPHKEIKVLGVDFGIKNLCVCSNGLTITNPNALKTRLKSIKRHQRCLSRKKKGSSNRRKQILKLSALHYKVKCVRNNAIHSATRQILDSSNIIVIEDLNVSGMVKNHNLAKALNDVSFAEFRRVLEYKAKWENKQILVADRFFPSSKTCSSCGAVKEILRLSERVFNCNNCGHKIDRDLNASINLANLALPERLRDVKPLEKGGSPVNSGVPFNELGIN